MMDFNGMKLVVLYFTCVCHDMIMGEFGIYVGRVDVYQYLNIYHRNQNENKHMKIYILLYTMSMGIGMRER